MKDITKGHLQAALKTAATVLKRDQRKAAQMMLPGVQSYIGGSGAVFYDIEGLGLRVTISISRTPNYQKRLRKEKYDG